jgi:hypothetical protein
MAVSSVGNQKTIQQIIDESQRPPATGILETWVRTTF